MKKWITNNTGLKVVSIVFALVLWLIVVNINNPTTKREFTNVQVELTNEDAITDKDKVCSVVDNSNIITVTVRGPRNVVETLSASDFKATADLTELTEFEFVPIEVTPLRYKDKLVSVESKTKNVKVSIEELSEKQFAIRTSVIGTPAEGYAIGERTLSQNIVKINGPASIMSTINRVVAEVNVGDMSSDINTPVSLTVYDGNDKPVDTSRLKLSVDSVNVSVEVLETKEVPIKAGTTGTTADGCRVVGKVAIAPETMFIAAKGKVLAEINEIRIPNEVIDVTGLSESFEQMIDISKYVDSNVTIIGDTEVLATITIEQLESKIIYSPVTTVEMNGLTDKYKCIYTNFDPLAIEVWGGKGKVEELQTSDVKISVDLSTIEATGNYTVPVTIELPEGYSVSENYTVAIHVYEGNLDYSEIGTQSQSQNIEKNSVAKKSTSEKDNE